MKKYSIFILAILSSFLLTSCFESKPEISNITPSTIPQDTQNDANFIQNDIVNTGSEDWSTSTNSFDSVKDAISKWLSLKCVYTDTDESKTTIYIKNDSILLKWDNDQQEWNVTGIIKWDTMFMWNGTVWMKLNLSTSPKDSIKVGKQSIKSQDDLLDVLNTQKDNCKQEDIDSTKFDLPEWIEFKDLPNSDVSNSGSEN